MIKMTGLDQIAGFLRALDRAWLEMDMSLSAEFHRWTSNVFMSIVYGTPQWTGDLAAAWTYGVNSIDSTYHPIANKGSSDDVLKKTPFVYSRGESPAVEIALHNKKAIPTWRDVVYIHNPAPIADAVENMRVRIRPINLVDGRVAMVQYHVDKFNAGGLGP